jgi:hypothetical protein
MTDSAAVPDGIRLAELIAELPLSRGSVFELLKVLGISTDSGPGPNSKGRVAWVSADSADRLRDAARRVHSKEVRIADLAVGLQRQPTRQTPQTSPAALSAVSADSADPAPFLARLEAAERAVASGLGLTTAEVSWILGVNPGAAVVTRGGITATRTARNCWRLESASPGSSV